VRQYQFDLPTTLRFRDLIEEYGRMRRLEAMTPQRRGQRFNQLVADLLGCWGTDRVQANILGTGEIDVAFTIDGMRFLLEAKWEAGPVSFDPIAKLSRRISQRLSGTRGVFLSMSGYTADAQRDVLRGQQPDMLLIDRTHLEAMLSGLFSPADLFTELVDRASYRGEVYTRLTDLVVSPEETELPPVALGSPLVQDVPVITETATGIHAEVVLYGTQPSATTVDGVTVGPSGRLLLTMPDGVAGVDLGAGVSDWAVPIPGCPAARSPWPTGASWCCMAPPSSGGMATPSRLRAAASQAGPRLPNTLNVSIVGLRGRELLAAAPGVAAARNKVWAELVRSDTHCSVRNTRAENTASALAGGMLSSSKSPTLTRRRSVGRFVLSLAAMAGPISMG